MIGLFPDKRPHIRVFSNKVGRHFVSSTKAVVVFCIVEMPDGYHKARMNNFCMISCEIGQKSTHYVQSAITLMAEAADTKRIARRMRSLLVVVQSRTSSASRSTNAMYKNTPALAQLSAAINAAE